MTDLKESMPSPTGAPASRRLSWGTVLALAGVVSWGAVLVLAGVVFLLALIGVQLVRTQRGVKVGDRVPEDLVLITYDGERYRLGDLRGKVVFINFWASWCKPCEEEAPYLQEAWTQLADRGDVLFLGVAWTDTDEKARAYLKRFQITYPNGPDLGTRWAQVFRIRGVPETYILDREGRLAYIKIGPFVNTQEILDAVYQVLGEK